jgi:hypothetical protein
MKYSHFRRWINATWYSIVDECSEWEKQLPKISQQEYIKTNKWDLKKQYKREVKPDLDK